MKKILATIALLLASSSTIACTELLGFSQTQETWWNIDKKILQWQARVSPGLTLSRWNKPNGFAWDVPVANQQCGQNQVTRIVLAVSDNPQGHDEWVALIKSAITVIRDKYPALEEIVLQPVVGGPHDGLCLTQDGEQIRASSSHPIIDAACLTVAQQDSGVTMGMSPEVPDCNAYSDKKGHLKKYGRQFVADEMEAYYGDYVPQACVPVVCN